MVVVAAVGGIIALASFAVSTWLIVGAAAIALVAGGVLVVRHHDLVRWMRTLRPMPIAYVPEAGAKVKLVGQLSCVGEPLIAPASQRPCGGWKLSVYQSGYRTSSGASGGKSPVGTEKHANGGHSENRYAPQFATDLVIDDGSGKAIIRASTPGTLLYLTEDGHLQNRLGTEGVDGVVERLFEHGIAMKWLGDRGVICFDEAILHLGSRVAAVGFCHWETGSDGERILVMEAQDEIGAGVAVCDDAQVVAVNPNNPAPGFRMAPPADGADAASSPTA